MSHDEIRAALAAATPGPWTYHADEHKDDGLSSQSPPNRQTICRLAYPGRAADAHLIAHAPEWLADLLAEVDRLNEEARAFAESLGFGDGRTEPAATLAQMIDPLNEAMALALDHIECAALCELCGEVLAATQCEGCHGSGCLPNAAMACLACGDCAGVGRIHVGCAEASYVDLANRAEAAERKLAEVREIAEHYSGRTYTTGCPDSILRALDGGES